VSKGGEKGRNGERLGFKLGGGGILGEGVEKGWFERRFGQFFLYGF